MVGDRASDVIAGAAFGVQTALVGDVAREDRDLLAARELAPTFEGRDLRDLAAHLGVSGRR
jgi:ribonucleotide monophosphatase NagD (HAD superfamily)